MKKNVLGVLVDATTYEQALDAVLTAARNRRPFAVTALAVHGVMTGVLDREHGARLNSYDLVTPDGQPVRWALNLLHGTGLTDRVCGPVLTERVLRAAADEGLPVYLYGSTEETLDRLVLNLQNALPALKVVGREASKFRTARPGEDAKLAARITGSGARILLVGLGCPRQEVFVHAMRPLLPMPLLAVGAAFDFHAGMLQPASRVDAAARLGVAGAAGAGTPPTVAALPLPQPVLPAAARRAAAPAATGRPARSGDGQTDRVPDVISRGAPRTPSFPCERPPRGGLCTRSSLCEPPRGGPCTRPSLRDPPRGPLRAPGHGHGPPGGVSVHRTGA